MKRLLLLFLLFMAFLSVASATEIASENVTVTVGETDQVTVDRRYADITTDRISFFVSGRYEPDGLSARDAIGDLDCTIDDLAVGQEILCTPRSRTNYSVTFTYTGDVTELAGDRHTLDYTQSIFVPTGAVTTRVILPEGFGLLEGDDAVQPSGAEVGSEGRRIFLEWERNDTELGEVIAYRVRYEELAVFERIALERLTILLALAVIVLSGAVFYAWRRRESGEKTIASIFPVLKEDEQEVLRYIIDHEGEVEQRDIVMDLDYSKAKVSRLVSDLAERNLVEKEKKGRINVVALARDVGDLNGT